MSKQSSSQPVTSLPWLWTSTHIAVYCCPYLFWSNWTIHGLFICLEYRAAFPFTLATIYSQPNEAISLFHVYSTREKKKNCFAPFHHLSLHSSGIPLQDNCTSALSFPRVRNTSTETNRWKMQPNARESCCWARRCSGKRSEAEAEHGKHVLITQVIVSWWKWTRILMITFNHWKSFFFYSCTAAWRYRRDRVAGQTSPH